MTRSCVRGLLWAAVAALALSSRPAGASPITIIGFGGGLSASVVFAQSGANLIVTLTNTSTEDVTHPTQVLTAVFFTLPGDPSLTPISALLGPGSIVLHPPPSGGTDPGGVVGGEWAYVNGLTGAPWGADEGIGSAGFDWFGPNANFPGSNLQGPPSGAVDGLQYGITSAGDDPDTGNTPVTGKYALIQDSVVFTLGLPASYTLSGVSDVGFEYGTSLDDPYVPGTGPPIPEPGTLLLLGSGALAAACLRRRKAFVEPDRRHRV